MGYIIHMQPVIKKTVTPGTAVKILASNGLQVSEEEAKNVLDLMYKLAVQTIRNEKSISLHQG